MVNEIESVFKVTSPGLEDYIKQVCAASVIRVLTNVANKKQSVGALLTVLEQIRYEKDFSSKCRDDWATW